MASATQLVGVFAARLRCRPRPCLVTGPWALQHVSQTCFEVTCAGGDSHGHCATAMFRRTRSLLYVRLAHECVCMCVCAQG